MELCHVMTAAGWEAARAAGSVPLEGAGFLHCCTPAQVDFVLGRHFAGVRGLVVVVFEADSVPAEVRWVKSEPDQDPFPHLYGAIPMAAVRRHEAVTVDC